MTTARSRTPAMTVSGVWAGRWGGRAACASLLIGSAAAPVSGASVLMCLRAPAEHRGFPRLGVAGECPGWGRHREGTMDAAGPDSLGPALSPRQELTGLEDGEQAAV